MTDPLPSFLDLPGPAVATWRVPPTDTTTTDNGHVHLVTDIRPWTSNNLVPFVDWRARCGRDGSMSGSFTRTGGTFGLARDTPRLMRCKGCWT